MAWLRAVLRTIRADIAEYRKAASAARHRRPTRLERLLGGEDVTKQAQRVARTQRALDDAMHRADDGGQP